MRIFLLAVLLVLAGCATRQPDAPAWEGQRDRVAGLQDWEFKGRMAVRVENDPDASGQLNIGWQQAAAVSSVRLSGPFGAGAWQLVWEPQRVSVIDAEGERSIEYTGPDAAAAFMRNELGWAFPADGIRYWVRGLPDPEADVDLQWSREGTLTGLRQYGWNIAYERYGEFDGLLLPTRFTIEGRGVRLRMAVSKWEIDDSDG